MSLSIKTMLRKYFIMGSQNCEDNPVRILEQAAAAGITVYQFREKGAGSLMGHEKLELGKQLREVCRSYDIPFIVNDDVDLVEPLDADGIHIGQDDIDVQELRTMFPDKIIGLSVSTPEELEKSPIEIVDYIGAGPVFPTTSKVDAKAVVGLEWIYFLRRQFSDLPIVGIGGIQPDNSHLVLEAGADGVSFISAVTKAADIKEAVRKL